MRSTALWTDRIALYVDPTRLAMQIPGQKVSAPTARRRSRRENALKLSFGARSVNDEIWFCRPIGANENGPLGPVARCRRSGSHSIYEIKRQVYEASRPLNHGELLEAPTFSSHDAHCRKGSASVVLECRTRGRSGRGGQSLVQLSGGSPAQTRVVCPSVLALGPAWALIVGMPRCRVPSRGRVAPGLLVDAGE